MEPLTTGHHAATCAIQLAIFRGSSELLDLGQSVSVGREQHGASDLKCLKDAELELADQIEQLVKNLMQGTF